MLALMSFGLFAPFQVAPARAEIGGTVVAQIPFRFIVGNRTLPAGKYEIKRVEMTNPNVLEIQSVNGHRTQMFLTEDTRATARPTRTELVFDRFGNKYFLSQIWVNGEKSGSELPKPAAEKRLERRGEVAAKETVVCMPAANHHNSR
jgi:hypothetical protein